MSSANLEIRRSSFISRESSEYDGIDQIEFFTKLMAYLQLKISQDLRGGTMAR